MARYEIYWIFCLLFQVASVESKIQIRCPTQKRGGGYAGQKTLLKHARSLVRLAGEDAFTLVGCATDPPYKLINSGLSDPEYCQRCRYTTGKCVGVDGINLKSTYIEDLSFPGYRLIATNGIPSHCLKANNMCENYRATLVPSYPIINADTDQRTMREQPEGPVAILKNGAFLVFDMSFEGTCGFPEHLLGGAEIDKCGGHTWSSNCLYHYHGIPKCWTRASQKQACQHLGFMHDGIPIYGFCKVANKRGEVIEMKSCYKQKPNTKRCSMEDFIYNPQYDDCNLDLANGFYFHEDALSLDGSVQFSEGQYGYFFSEVFPYTPPYFAGEPQIFGGNGSGVGDFCGLTPRGALTGTFSAFYSRNCYYGDPFSQYSPLNIGK